ncbi:MAG: L,D-transpeptidase family protein [Verrucomicrobiota bacterium]
MTQDIYVGQRPSKAGCLLIALLAVGILAGIVYWRWSRPARAAKQEEAASGAAAAAPSADAGLQLVAKARQFKSEDKLLEARDMAYEVLAKSSNQVARTGAEALLGEVNVELVLSPRPMPEKTEYSVQPGDSLAILARRFDTTVDALRKGNRITGSIIRAGDRLRIFSGKFAIEVNKSRNDLVLRLNDRFFKRYRVGTGQFGKTPAGAFVIRGKIINPPWWRPDGKQIPYGDTNNVLGTHWMSLAFADHSPLAGYGIHGTWEPDTIGKQASAGCIRLLNADVEELFTLVPEGTPVTITE